MRLVALVVLLAILGGCRGSDEPKGPDYTPIADADLFAQIADLPGVSDVDVRYRKEFSYGNGYAGEITVDEGADAAATLDKAYAILRQGRFQVEISVVAMQGRKQIASSAFGLVAGTTANLDERYGPQPGDGTPPAR